MNKRHTTRQRALMIVPTYNEVKNISVLLDVLFALPVSDIGWDLHVMVRDDQSPDGTGELVAKLAKTTYKGRLILSEGQKQGLGKALQQSFDEALKLDYDVAMTMDADFSHDPNDVPKLLEAINDGADVAIGSRYVDGGFIPGNWPLSLIIRTRVASSVARSLGGVNPNIKELTTNFRAMRMKVLQEIGYNNVEANGYGFQIYLANAFTLYDFKIIEVPISFHSRAEGESKAKFSDVLEFFKIAYKLNDDSPVKQVIRFLGVGLSGTFINLFSLWVMRTAFESEALVLSLLAIQISIIWNFTLHSVFTFRQYKRSTKPDRSVSKRLKNFVKYEGASSISQVIIFTTFVIFSNLGLFYIFAQALGISFAVIVNYYLSSNYIWSLSRDYA